MKTTFDLTVGSITIQAVLTAEDLVMTYKDGSAWNVTLTDGTNPISSATVKIGIVGKVYTLVTDADGVASLPINLVAGTYAVNATFDGDDTYEGSFANATVTVNKAAAVLSGENFEMSYKDGSSWNVTLTDANNNAIAGVKVAFGIEGRVYNIKTDDSGVAKLTINLAPGTYDLNASFSSNQYEAETITATVTVNKATLVLSAEDLVMTVKDGSSWNVTLTDANGNAIANTYIKFTISGKTYNRKTDANGVASLQINLPVGTYDVSAEFEDAKYEAAAISNTITVNNAKYNITAEDINMTYQDGTNYTVQLVDSQGNPVAIAGKSVKITIGDANYYRKTDDNGIATLPINLKAGTYTITAEHDGNVLTNTIVVNKA